MSHIAYDPRAQAARELRAMRRLVRKPRHPLIARVMSWLGGF